jgi:hypothetical protein
MPHAGIKEFKSKPIKRKDDKSYGIVVVIARYAVQYL